MAGGPDDRAVVGVEGLHAQVRPGVLALVGDDDQPRGARGLGDEHLLVAPVDEPARGGHPPSGAVGDVGEDPVEDLAGNMVDLHAEDVLDLGRDVDAATADVEAVVLDRVVPLGHLHQAADPGVQDLTERGIAGLAAYRVPHPLLGFQVADGNHVYPTNCL